MYFILGRRISICWSWRWR